mgnify:FL=1
MLLPNGLNLCNITYFCNLFLAASSSGRPSAYGVEYVDSTGVVHQAVINEKKKGSEIIISAGALGSPQLLMLSGIGPADHLRSFNISVVALEWRITP